jgi:hypothetical protein
VQQLKRLAATSVAKLKVPVRLPPGRLRLATSPKSTGSAPTEKTTGIDEVAAAAAFAVGVASAMTIDAMANQFLCQGGQSIIIVRQGVLDSEAPTFELAGIG